jgi:hypothetical protein
VPLERCRLNELATLDVLGLERLVHLAEPLLLGAQLSAGRRAALGDGGCGRFLPRGSKLDNGPQFIACDFKEVHPDRRHDPRTAIAVRADGGSIVVRRGPDAPQAVGVASAACVCD